MGMKCRVLHQTAALERELYGDVVSGSVGLHLAECAGPRPIRGELIRDTTLLIMGVLGSVVQILSGIPDPLLSALFAVMVGLPIVLPDRRY